MFGRCHIIGWSIYSSILLVKNKIQYYIDWEYLKITEKNAKLQITGESAQILHLEYKIKFMKING